MDGLGLLAMVIAVLALVGVLLWEDHDAQQAHDGYDETDEGI